MAGVKDLYTKELLGYAINKRMTADLVCKALNMAIKNKQSGKGNCYDNTLIESFWGVLKNELVYHQDYKTRFAAINDIIRYIELYYNQTRIQKGLGFK